MYSPRLGRTLVAVAAMICSLAVAGTASANKCSAGKVKCVITETKALLGCYNKAAGKGLTVDAACIQKAKAKFDGGVTPAKGCFEKLEAKGEKTGAKPDVVCPTSNDTAALDAKAEAFAADLAAAVDTASDANKCAAGKEKCATNKMAALLGCHNKALGKGLTVDATCLAKAKTKFDGGADPAKGCFEKLETKGEKAGAKPAVVCPTTNDTASIEAKVDAFVADVVAVLSTAGPTPTPTTTPGAPTATQTPGATPTPRPCGDGSDPQVCDPSSPGFACGVDFACSNCNCACPSTVHFIGNPSSPDTILDTGWTGISHRAPVISNGDVTVSLSCAASQRPCGVCAISGPIANAHAGDGELDDHRCSNDSSRHCSDNTPCTPRKCLGGTNFDATCTTDSQCPGGTCPASGTCVFFFGSNLPLAAGGVSTCVVNQFNGSISGTANVETGDAINTALLTSKVFLASTVDQPCPRCLNDTTTNDGNTGGTCDVGPRAGKSCDVNGSVPSRPDFGTTSLDCPPPASGIIATLGIDLSNATGTVTRALTASSANCIGAGGNKCLCGTCNNGNNQVCFTNADCPDPDGGGPFTGRCNGNRCLGGPNAGAPCGNNNSSCPSSSCSVPGEPTRPSSCVDDTATPTLDCADGGDGIIGDNEGTCTVGPVDTNCTVASGHGQRSCTSDADCGGTASSCGTFHRPCFLTGGGTFQPNAQDGTDSLVGVGKTDPPVQDVSRPTLAAIFCVAPTGSSSVNNVAGLPGPARVTINGTATGLP